MEEDSAFLSLITSNVIWREKQGVGSATHISLAELQRREMIQREGTPYPVSPPSTAGASAGHRVGLCPEDSCLTQQGLPGEGGDGPQVLEEWLQWMSKKLHQRQEASLQT